MNAFQYGKVMPPATSCRCPAPRSPDTVVCRRHLGREGDTKVGLTVANRLDAIDAVGVLNRLPPPQSEAAHRLTTA